MKFVRFCELEFESGLKNTKFEATGSIRTNNSIRASSFDQSYDHYLKKGEFNMKNNSYGEAILSFLKVYEILKRCQLPITRE